MAESNAQKENIAPAGEVPAPGIDSEAEVDVEPSDPTTWAQTEETTPTTGQHHYQLVVNPYDGTADLVKRDELDPEGVLAPVYLEPGTSGVIVQLFKSIDTDKSGELTIEDFQKAMGEDDPDDVAKSWSKLAKHFDEDSDGVVTMDEFRLGFKGYGIEAKLDSQIGFEAPYTWTVKQWIAELQSVMNHSVADQCKILGGWFQQFDGKMSEVRTQATKEEKEADTMLMAIYMTQATELQIHRLFDLMDKDENGVLEAADFAIMSKNAGTSSLWEELKANFDANGDECITLQEFKAHIAATVRDRISVGSIPRKDWTWRQVIGRLTEWSNRMVQQQCREIYDYISFGEYSSSNTESLEDEGITANAVNFGCGAKLGEPAFPGGEPAPEASAPLGFLAEAFGMPTNGDTSVLPAAFRGPGDVPYVEFAPAPPVTAPNVGFSGPPVMGPPVMGPPHGPPMFGADAWWVPSAVFSLQQQMNHLDIEDVATLRARRDERYFQTLSVLGQMAGHH